MVRFARLLPGLACLFAVSVSAFAAEKSPEAAGPPPLPCNTQGLAHTLRGTVTGPTNAAVPAATIVFTCGDGRKSTVTTGDGSFSLPLSEGTYQVSIHASGFAPLSRVITLGPNAEFAPLSFSLVLDTAVNTVTVSANSGFVPGDTLSATKTNTPLIETPQSVSVITADDLTIHNPQSVNDAIAYTPGVAPAVYGQDTRFDWITIRGFAAQSYGMFRDGLRWQSSDTSGHIEPFGLEQIDVLKGPASVLYGQSGPGGVINFVSKRPLAVPLMELEFDHGSYGRHQGRADFGGPLDRQGKVLYRMVGLLRNSNTQVDFVPDNRRFIAPSLTWDPSGQTALTFLAEWQYDRTNWEQFLPAQGSLLPNPNGVVPTHRYLGEPSDFYRRQQWSAGYLFEHHFHHVWTLRQNFRYANISNNGDVHYGFGFGADTDYRTLQRYASAYLMSSHIYSTDTQAEAVFHTGSVSHNVLVGEDYSNAYEQILSSSGDGGVIDVFHPVYGKTVTDYVPYSWPHSPSSQNGIYLQDQVKVKQHLIFTLGGREDWAAFRTRDTLVPGSYQRQNDSKFTGRTGVMYLTDTGFASYFSYSTSFVPTTGTNLNGVAFKPTTGKQYEVGAKYQPRNWNGFLTASFYNVTEQNVQTTDPANPDNTVQTGEVRSRGVELEGVTSLAFGLKLRAGYSYDDMVVTKANDASLGHRPVLVPEQTAGLLLDYTLQRTSLKGMDLGGGARYTGITAGAPDGSLSVPGYTLYDAELGYSIHGLRFAVNATNLADKHYVAVCSTIAYCNYGAARNVIGSASWDMSRLWRRSE
jgi:iron complex outermembrane receptor protein